jgi:hypothetical protein
MYCRQSWLWLLNVGCTYYIALLYYSYVLHLLSLTVGCLFSDFINNTTHLSSCQTTSPC